MGGEEEQPQEGLYPVSLLYPERHARLGLLTWAVPVSPSTIVPLWGQGRPPGEEDEHSPKEIHAAAVAVAGCSSSHFGTVAFPGVGQLRIGLLVTRAVA